MTTTAVAEAGPLPASERIALMDVLRGFALIGIVLMNIEWFSRATNLIGVLDRDLVGADFATAWLVKVLVEGKFYKLFSLLFGMGFAVMLLRAQAQDRPFGRMFSRRMAALFLFGLLHAVLFWTGDILRAYAIGGMLLLGWLWLLQRPRLQRFAQPGSQLKLSLWLMALPFLFMLVVGSFYALSHDTARMTRDWQERLQIEPIADQLIAQAKTEGRDLLAESEQSEDPEVDLDTLPAAERLQQLAAERARDKVEREQTSQAEITALTQPDFAVATAFRWQQTLAELPVLLFMALLDLFPLFLFGYWLVASGTLREPTQHRALFRTLAIVGFGLGVMFSAASVAIMYHPASRHVVIVGNAASAVFQLAQSLLAAGYLGLFVLAVQQSFWRRLLLWLAPLGRMALTNYLLQSVVLASVFYGYGWAQYGLLGRAEQLLIIVALIPAQWLFSSLWLRYFRYGPMEWLWRCITYWRWQPLRGSPAAPVAMVNNQAAL